MIWGHSSAGRAPAWHAGGQRFESAWLHQVFRYLDQLVWSIIHNNPYRIIMDKYGLLWLLCELLCEPQPLQIGF